MKESTGKAILITGASQGLGANMAKKLSHEGYHCLLLSRNSEKLHRLSQSLPSPSAVFSCSLEDTKQCQLVFLEIKNYLKKNYDQKLYALINNAGIATSLPFCKTSHEDWQKLFQVNLFAPMDLSRSFFDELKNSLGARVIHIASTAGIRPVAGFSAYSATKAALILAAETMALEWASHKIKVNCISPGIVDTPIHNFHGQSEAEIQPFHQLQPLGRVGKPEDISSMVSFLLNPNNNWITGSNFVIDGGITLQ